MFGWFSKFISTTPPIAPLSDVILIASVKAEFSSKTLLAMSPYLIDADQWVVSLQSAFDKFEINTPQRIAAFVAQTMYESAKFTTLMENLNYSANGLLVTFKNYFNVTTAATYARNATAIANHVYANRMGNGNEQSGDGWLYRGRGLIELTGKDNYQRFADAMEMNLVDMPSYLTSKDGACMSAAWFWNTNGLNELADTGDFTQITKKINGGYNGLSDRQALWSLAKKSLGI